MSQLYPSLAQCAVVATAFKVLLFPAYKSTDFEVHRNWLALTHSLPVRDWYFEKTSEWTLDYPPFFGYFEWTLSQAARFADALMLSVNNLEYDSWQTIYFQRTTVIYTELLLLYALQQYIRVSRNKTLAHAAAVAVLLSPGLLIIDHIHFQYNGFLYGILILSVVYAQSQRTLLRSGLLFAVLLCFKHIYLYLAPAYFVYLLRAYCLSPNSIFSIRFGNCVKLGVGIGSVFAAAFGPFAVWGQIPQVLSRLFPFSRGLNHAYWAPNIWALYSFADRILIYLAPRLHLPLDPSAKATLTRGLVGDTSFGVLPAISPRTTFILTLATMLPALLKLFIKPTPYNFLGTLTLCGFSSFLFGWHVHEKAILLVLLPFSLLCLTDRRHLSAFRPLAIAGHVSLFPLLFTPQEAPIKIAYTLMYLFVVLTAFDKLAPPPAKGTRSRIFLLDRAETLYLATAGAVVIYGGVVHGLVFGDKLEFLPLMFMSTFSAVGVVGSWLGFSVVFFST